MAALEESWASILSESITKELCDELLDKGWAMRDDVLGKNKGQLLIDEIHEISTLGEGSGFKQHHFQFGSSNNPNNSSTTVTQSKLFRKPNIFEIDMHDVGVEHLPLTEFKTLFHAQVIQKAFSEHLPEMGLINHEATLKIQKNIGNGKIKRHNIRKILYVFLSHV